jgi:hypothetical protein
MNMKQEVFGVIWTDKMLGPLTLTKPDAESAIAAACSMRERGADKIDNCRAVRVAAGTDAIQYLD